MPTPSFATADIIQKNIEKIQNTPSFHSGDATLMAVSKGQPAGAIVAAIAAGVTDFGENRVQEAQMKWPELKTRFPHIRLHLIGPLQTNKLHQVMELFDAIHTIDRPKLANAIASEYPNHPIIQSSSHRLYIQVNIGKESQKSGIMPQQADAFIDYCQKELSLPVAGLMCIPPHGLPPAPFFALLKTIAQRHGLTELSMGMSYDYETALRMGATCIRVGRGIFQEGL